MTTDAGGVPVIAISMGDPYGIGPEVVVKALADPGVRALARYVIHGLNGFLSAAAARAGIAPFWLVASRRARPFDRGSGPGVCVVEDPALFAESPELLDSRVDPPGPTAHGGRASFRFVESAIAQAMDADPAFRADSIVTAPISKAAWALAGEARYPGHTELLAERFDSPDSGMLFVGPRLRVVLCTIHIPLRDVPGVLTTQRVLSSIALAHRSCRELGIARPRIAVCGLNPHAGEQGLLGREDDGVIRPAVAAAFSRGIAASGPHPGDTIFLAAADGAYDAVVAMYHDQGLIPVKLLDRERTVNITAGLSRPAPRGTGGREPMARTSPAHGTAFDIAGRNLADPASMIAAIGLAVRLAGHSANNP